MSTDTPETGLNVTAFFDTREAAEQAISQVLETGLVREKILLRAGAARRAAYVDDGKGLLQEVKELILPSEEPDAAVEALKHEGFLLTIRPDAETHDAILAMLEQAGGKGLESREDVWPDWKSGRDASRDAEYPEGTTAEESDTTQAGDEASAQDPRGQSEPAEQPHDRKLAPAAAGREPVTSGDAAG